MMLILMIALIAAVDLCIKEEIEARDGSEFPKELIGTDGKIILHKSHNTGFPFQVLKSRPELVRTVPTFATYISNKTPRRVSGPQHFPCTFPDTSFSLIDICRRS